MISLSEIIQVIKDNQLLMAGLGLSGAGLITFWIRDVPKALYSLIKRELTTEVVITSQHKIFYELIKWIEEKYKNKNFRKLKLTNGKWGDDDTTVTSIGYGFHFIWYNKSMLFINLNKESANQTERDKESITLTTLGRSRKVFIELIKEIQLSNTDKTKTRLYIFNDNKYWEYVKDLRKRSMKSIYIEKDKKDELITALERFISKEQWYMDNGIPYQFGILLHGEPGTGKTSLIKAIASYLNYPIYYLPPHKLHYISTAVNDLPNKSILVIEDIDSSSDTHSREIKRHSAKISPRKLKPGEKLRPGNIDVTEGRSSDEDSGDKVKEELQSYVDIFSIGDLSTILNSLDGMFSVHGRILIATTNHIEKLDEALIRPGRIDLRTKVGFVNNEILEDFMNNFYPDDISVDYSSLHIKPEITVAMLQNMVLRNYSKYEIIDEITEV